MRVTLASFIEAPVCANCRDYVDFPGCKLITRQRGCDSCLAFVCTDGAPTTLISGAAPLGPCTAPIHHVRELLGSLSRPGAA